MLDITHKHCEHIVRDLGTMTLKVFTKCKFCIFEFKHNRWVYFTVCLLLYYKNKHWGECDTENIE
jgi:hypothetical protein